MKDEGISEAFRPIYDAAMNVISLLLDFAPAEDSPEDKLLDGIASAIEAYECAKYPSMDMRKDKK